MPVHHTLELYLLELYLDAYLDAVEIRDQRKGPVFRTLARAFGRPLSLTPLSQPEAWQMIRRRARSVGILAPIGCHTFRATGITAISKRRHPRARAQNRRARISSTTKLYGRTTIRSRRRDRADRDLTPRLHSPSTVLRSRPDRVWLGLSLAGSPPTLAAELSGDPFDLGG